MNYSKLHSIAQKFLRVRNYLLIFVMRMRYLIKSLFALNMIYFDLFFDQEWGFIIELNFPHFSVPLFRAGTVITMPTQSSVPCQHMLTGDGNGIMSFVLKHIIATKCKCDKITVDDRNNCKLKSW